MAIAIFVDPEHRHDAFENAKRTLFAQIGPCRSIEKWNDDMRYFGAFRVKRALRKAARI